MSRSQETNSRQRYNRSAKDKANSAIGIKFAFCEESDNDGEVKRRKHSSSSEISSPSVELSQQMVIDDAGIQNFIGKDSNSLTSGVISGPESVANSSSSQQSAFSTNSYSSLERDQSVDNVMPGIPNIDDLNSNSLPVMPNSAFSASQETSKHSAPIFKNSRKTLFNRGVAMKTVRQSVKTPRSLSSYSASYQYKLRRLATANNRFIDLCSDDDADDDNMDDDEVQSTPSTVAASSAHSSSSAAQVVHPVEVDDIPSHDSARNVTRELEALCMVKGWTFDMLLVDIPWVELGAVVGLGRVMEFIPNNLVPLIRRTLMRLYEHAASGNELELKKVLLAPTILFIDPGNNRRDVIREKCQRILNNDWRAFKLSDFIGREVATTKSSLSPEKQNLSKLRRVNKLIGKGEVGKAMKTLLSEHIASPKGDASYDFLVSKHPVRSNCEEAKLASFQSVDVADIMVHQVDVAQVNTAVMKSAASTRHGTDNFSIDILKQLWKPNDDFQLEIAEFHTLFTAFINRTVLNPSCCQSVREFMYGGEARDIHSPNKIRPITMGSLYRKIGEKAGLLSTRDFSKSHFGDLQVGAGAQFGPEKLVHSLVAGMEMFPHMDYSSSDYSDAFQHVARSSILDQYQKNVPTFFPLKKQTLHDRPKSVYVGCPDGIKFISTEVGVPQGAPASSFDFSLAVHPFNKHIDCLVSDGGAGGFSGSYADDTGCLGPFDNIMRVITHQVEHGPTQGLRLNLKKHVILLGHCDQSPQAAAAKLDAYSSLGIPRENIRVHPLDGGDPLLYGTTRTGIPIGSPEYIRAHLVNFNEKITKDFDALHDLDDLQLAFMFTRMTLRPKLNHMMRCLPPDHGCFIATHFEMESRRLLSKITGTPSISDLQFIIARLPVEEGGLGLGFVHESVDAAFIAGFIAALPLMVNRGWRTDSQLRDALTGGAMTDFSFLNHVVLAWNRLHPNMSIDDLIAHGLGTMSSKLQHTLRTARTDVLNYRQKVLNSLVLDSEGLGIFLGGSSKEAGAWLNAIPKRDNMKMMPHHFSFAVRARLLMKHPSVDEIKCRCKSETIIDGRGIHLQKCKELNTLTISTHDTIVNVLAECVSVCGLKGSKEPKHLFRVVDSDNDKHADLLVLVPGQKEVLADIRISNSVVTGLTTPVQGRAAFLGQAEKDRKYKTLVEAGGRMFIPVVIESQGLWGASAKAFLKLVLDRAKPGIPPAVLRSYWVTRIAVALQNKIADAVLIRSERLKSYRMAAQLGYMGIASTARETIRDFAAAGAGSFAEET